MGIGKLQEFLRTLEKQALETGRKEERLGQQSCDNSADTSEHWTPELTRTPMNIGHRWPQCHGYHSGMECPLYPQLLTHSSTLCHMSIPSLEGI